MSSETILPLIGVTACRVPTEEHAFQRVTEKYVTCIPSACSAQPVMIPASKEGTHVATLIDKLDGLFVTGSPSNVEPHHYGGPDSGDPDSHDSYRDATTLPLIRRAIEVGLPVFAVCRGIQEMNVALGGSLYQKVQDDPGKMDHRMRRDASFDAKYRPAHPVDVKPGGMLEKIWDTPNRKGNLMVNSLHGQAIDRVADGLRLEATAPDGTIEAVSGADGKGFALAVQWHPEWPQPMDALSQKLFDAFAEACRTHASARKSNIAHAAE